VQQAGFVAAALFVMLVVVLSCGCLSMRVGCCAVLVQARNIMLKSAGSEGRGVTAKVADFGLAVKMDHMETHLSNAFQVGPAGL